MSVDVQGLRSTIRNIKQQIAGLEDDVARLEQIVDEAEAPAPNGAGSAASSLGVPSSVIVRDPAVVADYLAEHPSLANLVRDLAMALVEEF